MDVRSPLFQNIAAILAGVMFLNPIVVAAAELTAAAGSGATVGQAGNGVPVVNIAAPNATGLSHNKFQDYNVGQQGLILNNATERTQSTQLGGIILGNSNLKGRAAGMILNEVTGSNASRLQGYTEVAGKSAHVIVANPHGITCDGCGFINTPRVTLSTGTPIIENGRLDRFDVNGGHIGIEGQGLNASNVDQFDLITRSAKINAELQANTLNVITGRNEVNASTLQATAKTPDGSDKPKLAIDSSALGGMYAGAIRLVGTEAGVGVKLAGDMAASAGDIQIDANGQLSMARSAAAKDLRITAQSVDLYGDTYAAGAARISAQESLNNKQSLAAGGSVALQARDLTNNGIVEAGVNSDNSRNTSADLTLNAQNIRNDGTLVAGRSLEASAGQILDNRGGTLSANTTRINAADLNNQQGRVLANQQLTISTKDLDNRAGLMQSRGNTNVNVGNLDNSGGDIIAIGELALTAATLDNSDQGRVLAKGQATVNVESLDNRNGLVSGKQVALNASGQVDNRNAGLIASDSVLNLKAGRLDSSKGGEVSARGDLTADVNELVQVDGRLVGEAAVNLQLNGGTLDNRDGLIHGKGPVTLGAVGTLDNRGGEISTASALAVKADRVDNAQDGRLIASETLSVDARQLDNQGGLASGWKGVSVTGGAVNNSQGGTLSSRDGKLDVQIAGHLDNSAEGALVSKGDQQLRAASLDNQGGIISGEGAIATQLDALLDNGNNGLISAAGELAIEAGSIRNVGGQLGGSTNVLVRAGSLDNRKGQLTATGTLDLLLGGGLFNAEGHLATGGDLLLKAGSIDNRGGHFASQGLLDLFAANLSNAGGTLGARDRLSLQVTGALDNSADGLIFSQAEAVNIAADRLDNTQGAVQGQTDVSVTTIGALNNRGGTVLSQQGDVNLTAASVDNSERGILNSLAGWLKVATSGLFSNVSGTTQGQSVHIEAGSLDNRQGHLSAIGGNTQIVTGTLLNGRGGLYARDTLLVDAASLDNTAGKAGAQQIDFSLRGALNNASGLIESASILSITAAGFTNDAGTIRALGQAGSTVISTVGGALDNRRGLIETANTDLNLNVAGLLNEGGTIRHVGTGTFGLASHLATQGGGSLITNGLLDIQAANWTNSGLIQAHRLNLDVSNFTQSASGKLLATGSLTGAGGNWINNGLIASDGSLSLNLAGGYSGNGQLTSLGDLGLTAAALELSQAARVAGGSVTTINVSGQTTNRGRLTSTGDLTLRSAVLNNFGTLGGAGQVQLEAGSLRNDRGLIFSAEDMRLRATEFTNFYGDVYSLRGLSIAGLGVARASLIDNVSATIESAQDMFLDAATVRNRRERFGLSRTLVSSSIGVYCNDCKGNHYNVDYIVRDIYEGNFGEETPASWINAGANLKIAGGHVANEASTVSAVGNIEIVADTFANVGAVSGTINRIRSFNSGRVTDGTVRRFVSNQLTPYNTLYSQDFPNVIYKTASGEIRVAMPVLEDDCYDGSCWKQTVWLDSLTKQYVHVPVGYGDRIPASQYNREAVASAQLPEPLLSSKPADDYEIVGPGGEVRTAVIQAGGNVSITASQTLENSDIRHGYRPAVGNARGGETGVVSAATQTVQLNSQLPPDLQQKAVNPLNLPGFTLPQGENGLFRLSDQNGQDVAGSTATGPLPGDQQLANAPGVPGTSRPRTAHKYLIETNPALTDLKQFMSSDYLLGNLGYDTDAAQKRLGDGLYEQRLIREAIVARTGQRYLAGLTSDEAMFRYLMDNALASKDALGLALGVSLTAEQVAALTHDIVWMEEHEVMGEKVLVPVLYLAQAEGRLAPNGALIQGRDVALISGGSLSNQGTLRASRDLDIKADNIGNSGLMQANDRLQLLATDSIRNAAGGIIAGRDVTAVALTGDIVNERSVTTHLVQNGSRFTSRQDFVDSAASIEAANGLTLSAGRDLVNIGGKLSAGGDASIDAGRDIIIASQAEENGYSARGRKSHSSEQTITQHGSDINVGGDLQMQAERDMAIVGSKVQTGGDVVLQAGESLVIASAADEYHADSYRKSGRKKVTTERDTVSQVGSEISAGGDFISISGSDTTLIASTIKAGDEAYLYAGGQLELLAADDSDYSLYDSKKKGSFGSKKTKRDEVTTVRNIGSTITTGGDLTLVSEGDQLYQKARLESGNDLTLESGGAITFEAVKDLDQESHEKSKSSLAWQSAKGKGTTDETLQQSVLIAKGETVINAVDGLKIDIKHVDQQTVSQTIEAMVQADPQLAWIKEAEKRGDVDWRRVKEVHDSFKYDNSGLGGGAAIVIAIVVAYFTAGAASAAIGNLASAAAGSGSAMAAAGSSAMVTAGTAVGTAAAGWGNAALTAVAVSSASGAAVSTINNRGNLGAVLKDVTSEEALKGYAVGAVTAGLTAGVFDKWTSTETGANTAGAATGNTGALANSGAVAPAGGLSSWSGVGQFAANQGLQNGTSALLSKALGQGGSLGDALQSTLANTFAAAGFNLVGDMTAPGQWDLKDGSMAKIGLHALMGGLAAEAAGGDFKTGALAAGVNEALVASLADQYAGMDPDKKKGLLVMNRS